MKNNAVGIIATMVMTANLAKSIDNGERIATLEADQDRVVQMEKTLADIDRQVNHAATGDATVREMIERLYMWSKE